MTPSNATDPTAPAPRLLNLAPVLAVSDVDASVAFYQRLGFAVTSDYAPAGKRVWAHLVAGDVKLMLAATRAFDPSPAARNARFASYLYIRTDHVAALHAAFLAHDLQPSPLETSFYGMQEFELLDPDGYRLQFAQPTTPAAGNW